MLLSIKNIIFAKRINMKYDYITKFDHLKTGLAKNGFVQKNQHCFSCKTDDYVLSIDFIHSVPKPKVKDYNVMVSIEYPKAVKIGQKLNIFTVGIIGANIGYLSPSNKYKVWRVAELDDNKLIHSVIEEMLIYIERYAIPFLKKYSTLENTIHEIEVGNKIFTPGSDYNLPIFYLLNNEKNNAFSFVNNELKRKELQTKKIYDDYPFPNQIIDENAPAYRVLNEYKEFASKFIEHYIQVENRGIVFLT